MEAIEHLLKQPPFSHPPEFKRSMFAEAIQSAFQHHMRCNPIFDKYCTGLGFDAQRSNHRLSDYPYLPATVFKRYRLISVPETDVTTTLSSSATRGAPSMVSVDAITARRQARASVGVMSAYLGGHRRAFLVLDVEPTLATGGNLTARQAAMGGFLMFAGSMEFFLTEHETNLAVDLDKLKNALRRYEKLQKDVCLFGFTYILYRHMIRPFLESGATFQLPEHSKVIHIGGWKKLEDERVDKTTFVRDICRVLGVTENDIIDVYGFTEQMGLVYVNTGLSAKTVPIYSEIIIRDVNTLKPAEDGTPGLIQVLTPLPHSYPGISILTEDIGRIVYRGGDSDGRYGDGFELLGRAEADYSRGCGDVMASHFQ